MRGRQPVTLSRRAWEQLTFEQRVQAMTAALDMALAEATRFELVSDDLSAPFIGDMRTSPPSWVEEVAEVDALAEGPRPLRWGCGCLGFLLKPLVWLGIAQMAREIRLRGRMTAEAAKAIQEAVAAHAAYHIRLWRDGEGVWESWGPGDDWYLYATAETRERLAEQLRQTLGIEMPLEEIPPAETGAER